MRRHEEVEGVSERWLLTYSALIKVYDMVDHITISGNTADVGEHNAQTDSFSWYLSVNRADTVRRYLVEYGLREDKISLEGYGHYNPHCFKSYGRR